MYILAKGTKFGKKIRIEVKNKTILINNKSEGIMHNILKAELNQMPVFDGTYIPQDPFEDVNIYNVLQNYFFDKKPEITANSITPIPNDELIY